MSKYQNGSVTHTVLGAVVKYNPRAVMEKLCASKNYDWLRKQYAGYSDCDTRVMTWVVYDIYKCRSGEIPLEQAHGILSLFLSGHAPSVQLLSEARLITIGPSG